jgi:hypothetical protein
MIIIPSLKLYDKRFLCYWWYNYGTEGQGCNFPGTVLLAQLFFYNFAKEAIADTVGGGDDSPEFPVEVANRYYPEKYQVPVRLQQGQLSWFPYLPEEKFGHAFDMSPIIPSLVRRVLSSKKATLLPCPDELMYGVLLRLPSTHSFLAVFCRLLLDDPDQTAKWCQSEIKLIYKDRDKNDPANFRLNLFTICVGKIYHQILADRIVFVFK